MAYSPKDRSMTIFEKTGTIDLSLSGKTRRWVTLGDGPQPDDDWFDNHTMSANPALGPGSLVRRATPATGGEYLFGALPSVTFMAVMNEKLTLDLKRHGRSQLVKVHEPTRMPPRSPAGHHAARNASELRDHGEAGIRSLRIQVILRGIL